MTTVGAGESDPGKFEFAQGGGESILTPEVMDIVSGVGNHEAKALLMIYLGDNPGPMRLTDMGRGFQDFIGDETEWQPNRTQAFNYCRSSFESVGQVAAGEVEHEGKWYKAYSISEQGQELGVPLAGMLLKWSVDNPDISLQQIFGSTRSAGKTRAPQSRAELIMELLTAPEQGLSITDIAITNGEVNGERGYHNRLTNIRTAAEALEKHGFVTVERVSEGNIRQFLVEDPTKPESTYPRGAVTNAVYDFLQERFEGEEALFNYEECLEGVLGTLSHSGKDFDEADIRAELSLLLGSRLTSLPGVKRLGTFNRGAHTRVTINEEHREALEDLANILMIVDGGDETLLAEGRKAAREIAGNFELKGKLMSKARRFSPNVGSQPIEQTAKEVTTLLLEAGGSHDTDAIGGLYKERYSRSLSKQALQLVMRRLIEEEKITVEKGRAKSSLKTTRNFYAAVVVDQD